MTNCKAISEKIRISEEDFRNGTEEAILATSRSYAPYSKFHVGASLMVVQPTGRKMIMGCNVENASFGLTICAERTAIVRAISAGYPRSAFKAMFVYS